MFRFKILPGLGWPGVRDIFKINKPNYIPRGECPPYPPCARPRRAPLHYARWPDAHNDSRNDNKAGKFLIVAQSHLAVKGQDERFPPLTAIRSCALYAIKRGLAAPSPEAAQNFIIFLLVSCEPKISLFGAIGLHGG